MFILKTKLRGSLNNVYAVSHGPLSYSLTTVPPVQSYFHQGESPPARCGFCKLPLPFTVLGRSWKPPLILGCSVTQALHWTCRQPFGPFSQASLIWFNVRLSPLWGPVTAAQTWGGVKQTMQWCVCRSKVTFDVCVCVFFPDFHPIITCRLLGNYQWFKV